MKTIRVTEAGGPEVLRFDEMPLPEPDAGQVRVRVHAAGVNFIDTYQRSGLYAIPLPATLGLEAAGVVEAIGPDVEGIGAGDRVAWTGVPGSYAEYTVVPQDKIVPLPESVSFRHAAAAMLQGLTAHYLTHATVPLRFGMTCLIHAAAGGVGLLLCQMARRMGAQVVGTVSTPAKAELARGAGAHETILYTEQDFEAETRKITGGRGVDVVYDSVGRTTFDQSLRSLARRGTLVLYGQSSGPVPAFDPQALNRHGSLFLTRPKLADHTADREELLGRAGAVLGWVADGSLKLRIGGEYPLAEAERAHRDLEGRRTTGKLLLIP